MNTKILYEAHVSDLRETPTAQSRFNEMFPDSELVWNKIYSLPFQVTLDTKTRDFQYKILNRILFSVVSVARRRKPPSIYLFSANILALSGKKSPAGCVNVELIRFLT